MRKFLSIMILALSLAAPVKRLDVARLQPVETVAVYLSGDAVVLETDTGNRGQGSTAEEALQNLKGEACSVIYLDTAEYLLVSENAQQAAQQLRPYLKDSMKVGPYNGGDIKEETAYWEVHGNLPKLERWQPME